jgi:hypothetical protein
MELYFVADKVTVTELCYKIKKDYSRFKGNCGRVRFKE